MAEAKATEVVAAEAAEAEVVEVVVAEAREVAEVAVVAIVAAMDRGRATIVVVVVVELGPKWSRSAAEKVVAQVRAKVMVEAEVRSLVAMGAVVRRVGWRAEGWSTCLHGGVHLRAAQAQARERAAQLGVGVAAAAA